MALLRWQRTIVDEAGNVIPNAEVEVRSEVAGTLASLFTDRDGTTPAGNPITADGDGYAFFYVDVGRYFITASDGTLTREWRDVVLPDEQVNLDARYYTKTAADAEFAKLSGGIDANFTTMPQVVGDPIVESGSNSDGEWTRWADGSQNVRGLDSTGTTTSDSTNFLSATPLQSRVFPSAFIANPTVKGACLQSSGFAMTSLLVSDATLTTTGFDGRGFSDRSTGAVFYGYEATGLWK